MSKEIKLTIVLQNPVDGLWYGLQKGKGSGYSIVQTQSGNGQALTFAFAVQAKQANGPGISLGGPFVQGPVGGRFVYISIGSSAGQVGSLWSGRLKVPLFEADFLDALTDDSACSWSCTVPGSTAGGKPVFATVKPFGGWFRSGLSEGI